MDISYIEILDQILLEAFKKYKPVRSYEADFPTLRTLINDPDIKKRLSRFGITDLKRIGFGVWGIAYSSDGFVVKFTGDIAEAKASNIVAKNPHPYIVDIYDVSMIYVGERTPIYMIIQEYVNPKLPNNISNAAEEVSIGLQKWLEFSGSLLPRNDHEMFEFLELTDYDNLPYNVQSYFMQIIKMLLHVWEDLGIIVWDMHSGNIGLDDKGNIKFFDIGASYVGRDEPTGAEDTGVRVRRLKKGRRIIEPPA